MITNKTTNINTCWRKN